VLAIGNAQGVPAQVSARGSVERECSAHADRETGMCQGTPSSPSLGLASGKRRARASRIGGARPAHRPRAPNGSGSTPGKATLRPSMWTAHNWSSIQSGNPLLARAGLHGVRFGVPFSVKAICSREVAGSVIESEPTRQCRAFSS